MRQKDIRGKVDGSTLSVADDKGVEATGMLVTGEGGSSSSQKTFVLTSDSVHLELRLDAA